LGEFVWAGADCLGEAPFDADTANQLNLPIPQKNKPKPREDPETGDHRPLTRFASSSILQGHFTERRAGCILVSHQ